MIDPYSDEYFMKLALQEAEVAFNDDEVPVGVVIVANQQIIARGHNLTEQLNDVTAHAEMQAIGGQIFERLYNVCYLGAVCHVCWSVILVSTRQGCVWRTR